MYIWFTFRCALNIATCDHPRLHAVHSGPCPTSSTITDIPSVPTQDGLQVAYDIFCLDLFHHNCLLERSSHLCGSNKATYINLYVILISLFYSLKKKTSLNKVIIVFKKLILIVKLINFNWYNKLLYVKVLFLILNLFFKSWIYHISIHPLVD